MAIGDSESYLTEARKLYEGTSGDNAFNRLVSESSRSIAANRTGLQKEVFSQFGTSNPGLLQELLADERVAQGVVISLGHVVAFARPAAADDHPVGSLLERAEHEGQIHPTGAHQADDPDLRCVALSGNSRQIRSGIRSPGAEESDDPRRVLESCHAPTPSCTCLGLWLGALHESDSAASIWSKTS